MNCLGEMISVYSVNKTCMEKTFYVLMNIAFDVRVCELLSSACKPFCCCCFFKQRWKTPFQMFT